MWRWFEVLHSLRWYFSTVLSSFHPIVIPRQGRTVCSPGLTADTPSSKGLSSHSERVLISSTCLFLSGQEPLPSSQLVWSSRGRSSSQDGTSPRWSPPTARVRSITTVPAFPHMASFSEPKPRWTSLRTCSASFHSHTLSNKYNYCYKRFHLSVFYLWEAFCCVQQSKYL